MYVYVCVKWHSNKRDDDSHRRLFEAQRTKGRVVSTPRGKQKGPHSHLSLEEATKKVSIQRFQVSSVETIGINWHFLGSNSHQNSHQNHGEIHRAHGIYHDFPSHVSSTGSWSNIQRGWLRNPTHQMI